MNSKDKLILILFRTPVNSMTVSDQGGGGGAGQRDQACAAIPDTVTVTYLYPRILGQIPRNKPRSEGPRLLLEKKEKLD